MQKVKMGSTDYILQIQAMVNSSFLRGEKKRECVSGNKSCQFKYRDMGDIKKLKSIYHLPLMFLLVF